MHSALKNPIIALKSAVVSRIFVHCALKSPIISRMFVHCVLKSAVISRIFVRNLKVLYFLGILCTAHIKML